MKVISFSFLHFFWEHIICQDYKARPLHPYPDFFPTSFNKGLRGRALVAMVRLLLCVQKVMGSSRGNIFSVKSKRKAAYDKWPFPIPHKARSLVHRELPFFIQKRPKYLRLTSRIIQWSIPFIDKYIRMKGHIGAQYINMKSTFNLKTLQ